MLKLLREGLLLTDASLGTEHCFFWGVDFFGMARVEKNDDFVFNRAFFLNHEN